MLYADILIRSRRIFTGESSERLQSGNGDSQSENLRDGFIAVHKDSILAIGTGSGEEYISKDTHLLEMGDNTVCPGFSDVHCFFTGYALGFIGLDLSPFNNAKEALHVLRISPEGQKSVVLGHGARASLIAEMTSELLDEIFEDRPTILFSDGSENCCMNSSAIERYGFTPKDCYPEAMWRLLKEMLNDRTFIEPMFREYMTLLNSRGITAIKEMGFDDFYGFTSVLDSLEKQNALSLRVSFMSQPVAKSANISLGKQMRSQFNSPFLRFSGYNRMTDGSISQHCGDLKRPYLCEPYGHCAQEIDYDGIAAEVLAADAEGFRFSLHAQGDAAVHKVLNIYERCKRDIQGRLVNRHSITDIEFSDPDDLERMGELGVIAEIYPQIQSIADRESKVAMIHEKIGSERGRYYWNRRKLADCGVRISCGTDLPLLIDDIPESIFHGCGGWFPEGGEPYNPVNTLTLTELLSAWTSGGANNLGLDQMTGTLEVGKKADIAVLDYDLFTLPLKDMRKAKVCMTLVDGKIVYAL